MPANRSQLARDDKLDDLVTCAQSLFLEKGFEATTMASIAKRAGVASNVVYWYFESKDHLFVAAMQRLVDGVIRDALTTAQRKDGSQDLQAGLELVVERLSAGNALIAAVHDRAARSPVVATFHQQVHDRYGEVLAEALTERGVPANERPLVVDALSTAVEGLVMHGASKQEARRMIGFLVQRLAPVA